MVGYRYLYIHFAQTFACVSSAQFLRNTRPSWMMIYIRFWFVSGFIFLRSLYLCCAVLCVCVYVGICNNIIVSYYDLLWICECDMCVSSACIYHNCVETGIKLCHNWEWQCGGVRTWFVCYMSCAGGKWVTNSRFSYRRHLFERYQWKTGAVRGGLHQAVSIDQHFPSEISNSDVGLSVWPRATIIL